MKILLVDDEESIMQSLKVVLEGESHNCVLHTNPIKGLEEFNRDQIDVVITDYRMSEMNGVDLLKELKELDSNIPVIIITAYPNEDNAIEAINNGAYAFFRKPLNLDDFMLMINKIDRELIEKKIKESSVNQLTFEYETLREKYNKLQGLANNSLFDPEEKL